MIRYQISIDGEIAGFTFLKPHKHKTLVEFKEWVKEKYSTLLKSNSKIKYQLE